MTPFIDAILYVPDSNVLIGYLDTHFPDQLERDDQGAVTQPPVVIGVARTPPLINGKSWLVYARLREDEVQQWRSAPCVEVLAEAPYQGSTTADAVYAALFADEEATAKYDSVYDRSPQTVDDEEGGTITITPPARFGAMA